MEEHVKRLLNAKILVECKGGGTAYSLTRKTKFSESSIYAQRKDLIKRGLMTEENKVTALGEEGLDMRALVEEKGMVPKEEFKEEWGKELFQKCDGVLLKGVKYKGKIDMVVPDTQELRI